MRPWTLEKDSGHLRVVFDGEVNEHADFPALLEQIDGEVVLDLEKVRRINSVGVHGWIGFVNGLQKRGSKFVLDRCSVPIVMQLNMIEDFRGTGEVRSVQAPYFCPVCNTERFRLVELVSPEIPESFACPDCGTQMYFDDNPEAFLAFRKRAG